MSQDINHVILIGRMVREIELKSTNSGSIIGRFTLASNRSEKRGDSYEDIAGFYECQIWGKRAETIQKFTSKGSKICVQGNLKWESWTGADGKKHSKVVINVSEFQFLNDRHERANEAIADNSEPPF